MANGHELDKIWGYSIRRIQVLADAANKRHNYQLYALSIAMRQAQGTEAKSFKTYLEGLLGEE